MSVTYSSEYTNSFALIIGINNYQFVNPLDYACNDAQEVASTLVKEFGFSEDNVTLLLNEDASKANIMKHFLKYANGNTDTDDRVFIFYAGHGHTMTGKRGETGFLIPVDGNPEDISTFIRWDDLTRNSDLFKAKHVLFVMDACYGGLAITRSLQPGSARFLKDMLRRYTRQVLTAGKANEVVADAGGPIPEHSIFTGHFLEALQGKAAQPDGTITANGVMAYVYQKVSNDIHSSQTPHFGYFDGDGDFIFKAPILNSLVDDKYDTDVIVEVPATFTDKTLKRDTELIELIKEYLSEERFRIKLDDLVNTQIRKSIQLLNQEEFSMDDKDFTNQNVEMRLFKYEQAITELQLISICLAYWGREVQQISIKRIILRLSENVKSNSGYQLWANMEWHPLMFLIYSTGIAAIINEDYSMLKAILTTKIATRYDDSKELVVTLLDKIDEQSVDIYKQLSNYERMYTPRSEYLFKKLQPSLDDLLFLGAGYEEAFDKFEIMLALIYADKSKRSDEWFWGPPGRFAWKYRSQGRGQFVQIKEEANEMKNEWPPLKAGLFNGSIDRFNEIYAKYQTFLHKLGWH
ncbi:caspase family protein [Paenibacillus phocaensis]|uniref:caspase family protein n=1 Tax=Paenibacillus phocaensis TaxID=1776378 RepID=UPI000839CA10|nr:caspase family protein [Paenibacillus phocaensis]